MGKIKQGPCIRAVQGDKCDDNLYINQFILREVKHSIPRDSMTSFVTEPIIIHRKKKRRKREVVKPK